MRIKCITIKVNNSQIPLIYQNYTDYLEIESEFWVFGIRFYKCITYFYIFDGHHLIEVPSDFFEVVDSKVSSEWKIKLWGNGEISLWPELFYIEMFLENFAEREVLERRTFETLKARIEANI